MKKIIATIIMLFVASQFSDIRGQKNLRMPKRTVKTDVSKQLPKTLPDIKTAEAFSDGNGVLLKWQTENETNLIGFNIYRSNGKENIRVNKNFILSSITRNGKDVNFGGDYNYFDETGAFQNTYSIESIFSDGKRTVVNPVLPRYTSDLKNVSTLSSETYRQSTSSNNSIIEQASIKPPTYLKAELQNGQSLNDPVNQKWIAAQPGVKINISKEGFYRITRSELEAAGFNVSASTNFWQLYLNGEEQSIIVDPNDQYIEFYGAAFQDTYESGDQTYFLVVGPNPGRRMDLRVVRPVGGTIPATTFYQNQTTKERFYYLPGVRNGENQNFFGTFISETPASVQFNVRGIDYSIRKTDMSVVIQGVSLTPHLTQIVVNGNDMGTVSGSNQDSMTLEFTIPTTYLNEGANTVEFTVLDGSADFSFFDSLTVTPQRKYSADNNQLSFYTNDRQSSDIIGFTSGDIRVFDVTANGNPTILTNLSFNSENGLFSVNIPAYETRNLYALTGSAIKQVDSIIQNNPSTLSTPAHNAELVIISYKNFLTEANIWADYRRSQGMSVEVVNVEDIYDEFNYGKLSAAAIIDFAQYAKNNWQTPPGYILLIGDATYDSRNFTGAGNFNFVPTKMVDTLYTETGSDDALTDFNNDGLAEIPIGRLPVRSGAEVTQLLSKVTSFEQNISQGYDRGSLCVSDLPNGFDFAALCSRIFNELPASFPKSFLNRGDTNAPTVLLDSLNTGKYFVNYSGHGNVAIWASSGFFNSTSALALSNGNNQTVYTMLTCLNGYFIEPASSSLSENLLKAENGGAPAVWASSSLTTPIYQEIMARRFYNQLGVGNLTRLGDLINDAKTSISGGRDVRLSWVLLGDPTLKVR